MRHSLPRRRRRGTHDMHTVHCACALQAHAMTWPSLCKATLHHHACGRACERARAQPAPALHICSAPAACPCPALPARPPARHQLPPLLVARRACACRTRAHLRRLPAAAPPPARCGGAAFPFLRGRSSSLSSCSARRLSSLHTTAAHAHTARGSAAPAVGTECTAGRSMWQPCCCKLIPRTPRRPCCWPRPPPAAAGSCSALPLQRRAPLRLRLQLLPAQAFILVLLLAAAALVSLVAVDNRRVLRQRRRRQRPQHARACGVSAAATRHLPGCCSEPPAAPAARPHAPQHGQPQAARAAQQGGSCQA